MTYETMLTNYLFFKYNIRATVHKTRDLNAADSNKTFTFVFVHQGITNTFFAFGQNQRAEEVSIDNLINKNYPELTL